MDHLQCWSTLRIWS